MRRAVLCEFTKCAACVLRRMLATPKLDKGEREGGEPKPAAPSKTETRSPRKATSASS